MGYFDKLIRAFNCPEGDIKELLDVMDEEQLNQTLLYVKESFPNAEEKATDARIERIESNVCLFEVQIKELEEARRFLTDKSHTYDRAIRHLSAAVICLATGFVAYVSAQIILSLV